MSITTAGQRVAHAGLAKLAAAVAVAAVASIILLPRPAHADNDGRRGQESRQDRGRHDNGWHGRRGPPPPPRYRRYPVYAPPPVYYPRDDSPGIRLIFPIDIH